MWKVWAVGFSVATGLVFGASGKVVEKPDVNRPNVIIIYGDDIGLGDVGAYGAQKIATPNIDRLAKEGLRFTDGHCSASTCTPSRFSMLTGVHGFREGVRILPPDAPLCISTNALTLPKLFKQAGYHTAVIGKWHLGIGDGVHPVDWNGKVSPGPLEIGFDYSFLLPSTNDRVPCVLVRDHHVIDLDPADPLYVARNKEDLPKQHNSTVYPDGKLDRSAMTYYESTHGHDNSIINGIGRIGYQLGGKAALWNDETLTDEFVNEARAYIKSHKDEPFFLYYASHNIHVPRAPHPRFQGATGLGFRGDAMVQFDWAVGEIMKTLEESGLAENTLVIFSSDNGPVYDDGYADGTTVKTSTEEIDRGHDGSGIYRGGKYQIYEGGTRIPFILRWPARIRPGSSDALVNQIDFMASFASLLDLQLPDGQARDSRNTMSALLGEDAVGHEYVIEESAGLALRRGDWKYIRKQKLPGRKNAIKTPELYRISEDPGEQNNLIKKYPELAESMRQQLAELEQAGRLR